MNHILEQYLIAIVHNCPTEWHKFHHLVEWSYNTSIHSSTGMTPYEIVYGKPPSSILEYVLGTSTNEVVDSKLTTRTVIHEKLKRRLLRAQKEMKHFADAKRRSNNFEVGQWVHVKLRPCIINCQTNFFGPFEITEPIGKVAYRLCLPENSKIHLVLHSSLLWPHYGPLLTNSNALPPHAINNNPILEPLAILSQKMDTSTSPPTKMVII